MICHVCGVEAPTKHVSFYQNIGALVMRFSQSLDADVCKSCLHEHFWKMTGTTLILGWWGAISLIVTPFFLLNNIIRYSHCLTMEPVPPGAVPPTLTEEAVEQIKPHAQRMFDRLNQGEKLERVAEDVASWSGASPAQVVLFLRAIVMAQPE